ncbi:MAG: SagB/ThcOx family dehydrogenase [Deltaproteobacteria bacterium]|jgi:SagB-type dehydrogenase family enzyme|nr:SagB/ThcOx family dehydrogenase [Deltaproteobacteria bacterium]
MKDNAAAVIFNGQRYQEITSYDRLRMPRHTMDWSNVPRQTKSYPALPTVALEPTADMAERSFWQVMQEPQGAFRNAALDIQSLSTVLGLAYGYTARQRLGGQEYLYRSVPSAGALYPVEVYVSGAGILGLPPGLFHYNIQNFSLQQLRDEHESTLIAETLGIPTSENSWISFILSGLFFRSSWKYRDRAFRYVLLDTGHLVENLASTLAFAGLPCSVRYDFVDERLCSLVGLDRSKEACFAILDVRPQRTLDGMGGRASGSEPMALGAEVAGASRVSSQEVTYDAVKQIYFASSKPRKAGDPNGKTSWVTPLEAREWFPVRQPQVEDLAADYIGVIQGRRSRRNFVREPIPVLSFMRLLSLIGTTPRSCLNAKPCSSPAATGFLVGHVEGFDQGYYRYDGENRMYGLLESGFFVEKMAGVCLDQRWLANAGALFLFMANLKALDDSCGARGYRYAMMEAGILGQRLYLGSAALGLGCCGIGAFYDAEARDLLSLNDDSYLLYLVAVGNVKK